MYAAHSDHPHVANELLLKGANILSENRQKDTCYSIAVKRKSKSGQKCVYKTLFITNLIIHKVRKKFIKGVNNGP